MIGVVVPVAFAVVAIGLWIAVIVLGAARHRRLRRAARMMSLLGADVWLWAVAFDAHFGPVHDLRPLAIIVNAVLLLGAVNGLFGVRLKYDVGGAAGGRYAGIVGRDESMRLNGLD